jgi:Flp pilus assembly protein TadD
MAYAWLDLGRPERAEKMARELLSEHPDSERWLSLLGVALERQGHLELALEQYSRAIAADPEYAPAHNNLAAALVKRGDRLYWGRFNAY